MYVDFLDPNQKVYQEVRDLDKLRAHLTDQLQKYNEDPKQTKMDLVLFKDAICHIARVYRVISQER